jgi:hypothetical protein
MQKKGISTCCCASFVKRDGGDKAKKKKGFIDWPVDMGGAAVPATSSLRKCFKAIENTA